MPPKVLALVEEVLSSKDQIEKYLEECKDYLNKQIEQPNTEDDVAELKKSLVACMKLDRNFKRFFKMGEAYLNNQDGDKSIASTVAKILKRVPQVKKTCIMFNYDCSLLEQIRSALNDVPRVASSVKETKSTFRKSLGDTFADIISPPSFAPPPPPKVEPKLETDSLVLPPITSQNQLLQLEVKLKGYG
jgi:hypothetical protein